MLTDARVATRMPVQDLARARRFYASTLGMELRPGTSRPVR